MEFMGKKTPLTRHERRERRAAIPDARVYRVMIIDAGAQNWRSRLVFFAATPEEAAARLKSANLYKRVIESYLKHDEIPAEALELARAKPGVLFLSQDDDGGWSAWMELPVSYQHPPQGQATKHQELRWPPNGNHLRNHGAEGVGGESK
jgi:hypothetical protein